MLSLLCDVYIEEVYANLDARFDLNFSLYLLDEHAHVKKTAAVQFFTKNLQKVGA